MKKFSVVTTFNEEGFRVSGKKMIKSFDFFWNKDISLNTFLFSSFVLLLIIYNNTYTQYKINELENIWMYLFLLHLFLCN